MENGEGDNGERWPIALPCNQAAFRGTGLGSSWGCGIKKARPRNEIELHADVACFVLMPKISRLRVSETNLNAKITPQAQPISIKARVAIRLQFYCWARLTPLACGLPTRLPNLMAWLLAS